MRTNDWLDNVRHAWLAALLTMVVCMPAGAQTTFEGSFGYQVVDYKETDGTPVGWFASFAARPAKYLALVSEFAAEFQSDRVGSRTTKQQAVTFVNGARLVVPARRVALFGEALMGIAHDRDFFPTRPDANRFIWQLGGGLDIRLTDRISARFQTNKRFPCCHGDSDRSFAIGVLSGIVISGSRPVDDVDAAIKRQLDAEKALEKSLTDVENAHKELAKAIGALASAKSKRDASVVNDKDDPRRVEAEAAMAGARVAVDRATVRVKRAEARMDIARSRLEGANAVLDNAKADLQGRR